MSTSANHNASTEETKQEPAGIRLQRFLASTGLGSRRHCEEFIVAGRVNVDGKVVRDLGTRVDSRRQTVRVDGQIVHREPARYFVLNKPRGYLCTNLDPDGRPRAIDLVPAGTLRLFTVGRLDEGSEGLILITNDGELAHRLAHPRFQVPRKYAVQVAGRPTSETLNSLKRGIYFEEGRFRIETVRRSGTKGNSTFLEVGLHHGQNREIRRLFARVGHKVMRLKRVSFGPLSLGRLPEGRFRTLLPAELKTIRDLASQKEGERHRSGSRRTSAPSVEQESRTPNVKTNAGRPRAGRPEGRRAATAPLKRQGHARQSSHLAEHPRARGRRVGQRRHG